MKQLNVRISQKNDLTLGQEKNSDRNNSIFTKHAKYSDIY